MANSNTQKIIAPYRVVIIEEDSLEEVYSFALSRSKVYMFLCSLFVFSVLFTVLILVFTPLKYYIPGYGSSQSQKQIKNLQSSIQILGNKVQEQEQYINTIKHVINGDYYGTHDTTMLDISQIPFTDETHILPDEQTIKANAAQTLKNESQPSQ